MKLRVTYRPRGEAPLVVQITADATASAGDVARALAPGPGADAPVPEAETLTLQVTDASGRAHVLPATEPVLNSGLVSGSDVKLRRVSRHANDRGEAVACLLYTSPSPRD